MKKSVDYVRSVCGENLDMREMVDSFYCQDEVDGVDEVDDISVASRSSTKYIDTWISGINAAVYNTLAQERGEPNVRYSKQFAERLMKQIRTIPLWSCIVRSRFGFGRVPASSAAVESTFKTIKQLVLPKRQVRLDVAVETLIKYESGKMKQVEAALNKTEIEVDGVEPILRQRKSYVERKQNIDISLGNMSTEINADCPACRNGQTPTGAHRCVTCGKKVHALTQCSIPFDEEEGHGQRRVCVECVNDSAFVEKTAMNACENWGGLGTPKRKSYYLSKNQDI